MITKLKLLKVTLLTKLAGGNVTQGDIKKLVPNLSDTVNYIEVLESELSTLRSLYLKAKNERAYLRAENDKLKKLNKFLKDGK